MTSKEYRSALAAENGEPDDDPLNLLSHWLLSFREDADLTQAAVSQASVFYIVSKLDGSLLAPEDAYASAISEHWKEKLASARFRFGSPHVLEDNLCQLEDEAPTTRAKKTLLSVLISLSASVPYDTRKWLAQSN